MALSLTAALIPVHPASAVNTTYRDVDNQIWYAPAIEFCQQHQLMDGTSHTSFAPTGLMTRAVLAEALYRLEGSPEVDASASPFSDVDASHPNASAIRWAAQEGVVSGYPDGRFGPEDPITREQIAALLWNNQGQQSPAPTEAFADADTVSDWAGTAVEWVRGAGLMAGGSDNLFFPLNNTSRAEGAIIVMNYAKGYYGLRPGYTLPESQPVPPNEYGENFLVGEDGYLTYIGEGPSFRGLDVSSYQKEVDWAKVAAAGMDFAIIRAGYRGYTTGGIVKDAYFESNIKNALANGLDVGVYIFSQALTPQEAEEEAYQLLEWVKGYDITYPLVFDWEEIARSPSRPQGASGNTVTACALAFCKVIEDAGYIPMTYGSPNKIYSGGLMLEHLQEYPSLWLANYTRGMAPTSFRYRYDMWQYSSTGRVDGIEGNVDLNICLTDWSTWGSQTPDPDPEPEEPEDPKEYPWWLWPNQRPQP